MTISSRALARSPRFEPAQLREVAAQFEALLFAEAFAPLARAMGFYGDTVVATAAQAMIRGEGSGFTGPLEAAISSAMRDGGAR